MVQLLWNLRIPGTNGLAGYVRVITELEAPVSWRTDVLVEFGRMTVGVRRSNLVQLLDLLYIDGLDLVALQQRT